MGKTAMKIIASPIYAGKSGNQFLRKVFKLYLPNTVFKKKPGFSTALYLTFEQ